MENNEQGSSVEQQEVVANPTASHEPVSEQQVLDALSQETGKKVSIEEFNQISRTRFQIGMMQLIMNSEKMSKESVMRALTNAIDFPVQCGVVKPIVNAKYKNRGELEMNTAGIIAQLLDLRNVILADLLKKKEQDALTTNTQGSVENVERTTEQS